MDNLPCPICAKGRFDKEVLETRDIVTGDKFKIIECSSCRVKHTYPVPVDISRYYETDIGSAFMRRDPKVYAFFKNVLLGREMRRLSRLMGPEVEFLDVGCGTGNFSRVIHHGGYKVSAVDSSPERPADLPEGVAYYMMDYENYNIQNIITRERTVILRHVLEHIKDPVKFLNKLIGYGAGSFYILLPNAESLKGRLLGRYNWQLDPPRHIWHFSRASLAAMSERLGLEMSSFGYETIPTFVASLYRYLRLNGYPEKVYNLVNPKSPASTLSLPLDWLMPGDAMWMILKRKK